MSLPNSNDLIGDRTVGQLQDSITLEVEETSDSTANMNINGTLFTYSEPNTPLRYKGKRTRNACLVLHIDIDLNDTLELADAQYVSIFDFDHETGMLVLETTDVLFACKIVVKHNGNVTYTWTIIPTIQTEDGFFLSDDDYYGDNNP